MSLTRTKRKRRLKNSDKSITDVTLNDFANSDKVGNSEVFRKKIGYKVLLEEVKSLSLNIEVEVNNDNEYDCKSDKEALCKRRRRKCKESIEGEGVPREDDSHSAITYPADMWNIIGEYIRPEDVGRFAAICKSTREVVASPGFWLRLRRRYIGDTHKESEKNNYALRAQVIRALRKTYLPHVWKPQPLLQIPAVGFGNNGGGSQTYGTSGFRNCWYANKAQHAVGPRRVLRFTGDHHLVLGACCMQSWQENHNRGWVFYIKLKHPSRSGGINLHHNTSGPEISESSNTKDDGTPDCWMSRSVAEEILGNEDDEKRKIWANDEEGCKVIEVMLDKDHQFNGHFGPCPQILGLSLVWACARQTSTTCESYNSRSLALLFGPPHLSPKAASSLLPRQSVGWKSCGGGWAEPVSEEEEIALALGIPAPKGAKCGVKRQSCCKGGPGFGTAGTIKGFSYPEGMVPVVLPGVNAVRLLDWWDADYPYPEVMNKAKSSCGGDEEDENWMS